MPYDLWDIQICEVQKANGTSCDNCVHGQKGQCRPMAGPRGEEVKEFEAVHRQVVKVLILGRYVAPGGAEDDGNIGNVVYMIPRNEDNLEYRHQIAGASLQLLRDIVAGAAVYYKTRDLNGTVASFLINENILGECFRSS